MDHGHRRVRRPACPQRRATLSCDITALEDLLIVSTVRAGLLSVDRSRFGDVDAGPGDAVLIPPRGSFRTAMHQVELDTVALTSSGLADYAEVCGLDADRLQITGTAPITRAAAERWELTTAHIRTSLLSGPAAENPRVHASAARLLYAAFLHTFPHTLLDELTGCAAR